MSTEREEEYVVEAIHKWTYNRRKQCRQYWIKWSGYSENDNTWEPESNLNCPVLLKRFENNLSEEEKTYYFSTNPAKLNGFQRNATLMGCIGGDLCQEKGFVCLLRFKDDERHFERHDPLTFAKYYPQEAIQWCEGRILEESAL